MNTIIINKIIMHMLDFEHSKIYHSGEFVDLNETNHEYYKKKVEKTLYSTSLKEIKVGSMHELMLRCDKMIESDEDFIKQAHDLTDQLYSLGKLIGDMPNSNVLFVDCYKDGQKVIAIIKLNYRSIPMSVVEEGIVRITKQQVLPTQGAAIDEAIVINADTKQLFLIEKKYMIDGKNEYYLNSQWIKGEEALTDKQKLNTMKKVVSKLDEIYHVSDGKALPLLKAEINEKIQNNQPIVPIEIAKKVLEKDYQAQEESEMMLKDLGIDEKEEIRSVTMTSLDKCKLVLNGDIEVNMLVTDYLEGTRFETKKEEDGTYSIIFKDINEVIVK